MPERKTLPFVVEVDTKGGSGIGVADIPVERLRASLKEATGALAEVFEDIWQVGNFQLNEVTIGLEVSAEGGVQFIGSAKVGGKGSISLKFVPPAP